VKACFQERVQTKNPRRRSLQGCRVSAPPFKDRRRQSLKNCTNVKACFRLPKTDCICPHTQALHSPLPCPHFKGRRG
jgi:hypothetical protein